MATAGDLMKGGLPASDDVREICRIERRPIAMVYAAIDIHKSVFQVAVLDRESGELREQRFTASREALDDWAMRWLGRVQAVAVEATTGRRWVAACLQAHGFEVRLVDPSQSSALQGRRRRPKTDRLDARWLVQLLARELAPAAWLAPEQIQCSCATSAYLGTGRPKHTRSPQPHATDHRPLATAAPFMWVGPSTRPELHGRNGHGRGQTPDMARRITSAAGRSRRCPRRPRRAGDRTSRSSR